MSKITRHSTDLNPNWHLKRKIIVRYYFREFFMLCFRNIFCGLLHINSDTDHINPSFINCFIIYFHLYQSSVFKSKYSLFNCIQLFCLRFAFSSFLLFSSFHNFIYSYSFPLSYHVHRTLHFLISWIIDIYPYNGLNLTFLITFFYDAYIDIFLYN